jgi:hypothetical protein
MFYNNTMMSIANMDNTLRGWAKLDTAAGETAIQSNVIWDIGIVNYTDATVKQYLIDTYGWTIRGGVSLRLEVALYPINKSLRSIISALAFVFMFPTVKSLIISLPAMVGLLEVAFLIAAR